MSYLREFETVIMLSGSKAETRGVDAFVLCVIKMERQVRRLFTFSIFQFPCFAYDSIPLLVAALADERIYLEGLIKGFEAIHPISIADLVGADYARLVPVLDAVRKDRNKIFHGQLTGRSLERGALFNHVSELQDWCKLLGNGAQRYMGYEGFDDSFQKASDLGLDLRFLSGYKLNIASLEDYKALLRTLR